MRPREAEQASSHDWPDPARNQPESSAVATGMLRARARASAKADGRALGCIGVSLVCGMAGCAAL